MFSRNKRRIPVIIMHIKILSFLFLISSVFAQKSLVNTSHLDHLYETVNIGKDSIGIIHIYSEAPDYHWVGDEDEGIACIDDAARAAVFYMKYYSIKKDSVLLYKIKNLLNFNIYMQAENGFFYNFIWKDLSINKNFKTSVAEPNWWSWRAIWALSEGALFFKNKDQEYYKKLLASTDKGIKASLQWFTKEKNYKEYGGYKLPGWFPYETASDQSSVIVKGLLNYYQITPSNEVKQAITNFCNGLLEMQFGDKTTPPYNAFFSWQNTWHAWGNSQSDALLDAGIILKEQKYVDAAKKEIRNFYPFLLKNSYYNSLTFTKKNDKSIISDSSKFSQIAYGIRPMVFAALKTYEITNEKVYLDIAVQSAMWFFGKNSSNKNMYDINTGVVFDGINDSKTINKNSGAESTIEALLVMNRIEMNKKAKNSLLKLLNSQK